MKTAISLPDGDFERFERIATRHGMNRSEFYRRAGQSREFLDPYPVGHLPSYLLAKVTTGIRLVMGI